LKKLVNTSRTGTQKSASLPQSCVALTPSEGSQNSLCLAEHNTSSANVKDNSEDEERSSLSGEGIYENVEEGSESTRNNSLSKESLSYNLLENSRDNSMSEESIPDSLESRSAKGF